MITATCNFEKWILEQKWDYRNVTPVTMNYDSGDAQKILYAEPSGTIELVYLWDYKGTGFSTGTQWWAKFSDGSVIPVSIMTGKHRADAEILKYRIQKSEWGL